MFLLFGTIANKKHSLNKVLEVLYSSLNSNNNFHKSAYKMHYSSEIENYIFEIEDNVKSLLPKGKKYLSRWVCLKLFDENSSINSALKSYLDIDLEDNLILQEKLTKIKLDLKERGLSLSSLRDDIVSSIISKAECVRKETCTFADSKYSIKNKKIDKILTSKKFGIPIMLLFFGLIFWITIVGANYPSQVLSDLFGKVQVVLLDFLVNINCPEFLTNILIYRHVSNSNLGCICYASTYGNIFPIIYTS